MNVLQSCKSALWYFSLMFVFVFYACEKDVEQIAEPNTDIPQIDMITQKVNKFVVNNMYDAYLWDNKLPNLFTINIDLNKDPFKLLDGLIYKELDLWTHLSDNANQVMDDLNGVGKTFGYKVVFAEFANSKKLFGIVQFVHHGTPAKEAGIKRGDLLTQINGADITMENAMQVYYADKIKLEISKLTDGNYLTPVDTLDMKSIKMELSPLVKQRIIEVDNHKVGYLCYSDYQINSHDELEKCFMEFKSEGITDMVLDLRYNPGGYSVTSQYLCSILAPEDVVNNEELYLKNVWNDLYTKYFIESGREDEINITFDKTVAVNMNLPRLYVLTSGSTASASEATIIGLQPYMDVIQIGTTTHGKYCGAYLLQPWIDNDGTLDKDIDNWMFMMVVYKFVNKNGVTDFKNGLTPNHVVEENLLDGVPLGNVNDPLLSKALSLITGSPLPITTKSASFGLQYTPLLELNPKWNMNGMVTISNF